MVVIHNTTLYTPAEVAKILGVTLPTVYSYVNDGRINGTKLRGATFVSEAALIRYLQGGK